MIWSVAFRPGCQSLQQTFSDATLSTRHKRSDTSRWARMVVMSCEVAPWATTVLKRSPDMLVLFILVVMFAGLRGIPDLTSRQRFCHLCLWWGSGVQFLPAHHDRALRPRTIRR